MVRILLTGGGSGGHIYPLLAVIEELKKFAGEKDFDLALAYMGSKDAHSVLLKNANVKIVGIASGKLRRYLTPLNVLKNLIDIPKILFGTLQALWKMFVLRPRVVFSKGGTGAFPVVFAAWFYRIPILIHESDATPGLTNLLSSRFAIRIATSFELTTRYFNPQKVAWTGNPIRDELMAEGTSKEQAKEALGFKRDAPLLFVIGGSQGAQPLNEFIILNLPAFLIETQILHQTGKANITEMEKLAKIEMLAAPKNAPLKKYHAVGFLEKDLPIAYAAADIVVTRAGAGVLFEIAACGKPALLIPIAESANGHQRANAYEFAKTGGGIVIEEENLFPGVFMNQLKNLLRNPGVLDKMSNASKTFFKPNAKRIIAEELVGLALTKGE